MNEAFCGLEGHVYYKVLRARSRKQAQEKHSRKKWTEKLFDRKLFNVCIRQNRKILHQLTVFIPGHCKLRTYTESRKGQMQIRCGDRGNKRKPPYEVRCVDIQKNQKFERWGLYERDRSGCIIDLDLDGYSSGLSSTDPDRKKCPHSYIYYKFIFKVPSYTKREPYNY